MTKEMVKNNNNANIILLSLVNNENIKLEEVKSIIDKGADVNAKDREGDTALIAAFISGSKELAMHLIDKGADVNAKDREGDTALIAASKKGLVKVVKALIDKGADVDEKDKNGNTILHKLCTKDSSLDIIKLLIENGADVNKTNKKLNKKNKDVNEKKDKGLKALDYLYKNKVTNSEKINLIIEKTKNLKKNDHFVSFFEIITPSLKVLLKFVEIIRNEEHYNLFITKLSEKLSSNTFSKELEENGLYIDPFKEMILYRLEHLWINELNKTPSKNVNQIKIIKARHEKQKSELEEVFSEEVFSGSYRTKETPKVTLKTLPVGEIPLDDHDYEYFNKWLENKQWLENKKITSSCNEARVSEQQDLKHEFITLREYVKYELFNRYKMEVSSGDAAVIVASPQHGFNFTFNEKSNLYKHLQLHFVADKGSKLSLKTIENIVTKSNLYKHLLHFVADKGSKLSLKVIENIVNSYAISGQKLNEPDQYGKTPLMYAMQKSHFNMFEALTKKGVDVCSQDINIGPALDSINQEMLMVLIKYRAKINFQPNEQDETLMHDLCEAGLFEHIKLALECGFKGDLVSRNGKTLLHKVLTGKSQKFVKLELIDLLCKYGASKTINSRDNRGNSPLEIAKTVLKDDEITKKLTQYSNPKQIQEQLKGLEVQNPEIGFYLDEGGTSDSPEKLAGDESLFSDLSYN